MENQNTNELSQAVIARIEELLKTNNWSSYKLAMQGAIAPSTLSNIILGKCKSCNLTTILNICRGFNIELSEFFSSELLLLENLSDND